MGKKKKSSKPEKKQQQFSWVLFAKTFKEIWPYVWPSGNFGLQVKFITAFLIIGINRGLNVLIPIYYKQIVDNLQPRIPQNTTATQPANVHAVTFPTGAEATIGNKPQNQAQYTVLPYDLHNQFRWDLILILVVLKLLSGPGGYLNSIRGLIWIPVLQNAQKKLRLQIFQHIHRLSVKWHQENKRTGAIVTLTDRGVVSMNHIISNLVFNVIPTMTDIIIAFVFFVTILNVWTAFIVFSSILGYLIATVALSEWRTKFKKGMVKADNERSAVFVDSVINADTVKCFTGEETELDRYRQKIDDFLDWDWKADASSKMIMFIQRTMMMAGLLGVSMLVAWYVWIGKFTTGDFVLFSTYVEQLYSPLTMFSACYRILQDACMNMEHMLDVLRLQPDITDHEDAVELSVNKGEVIFDEVYFSHTPSKPLLKGITFTVPPGHTYAIVGDSGGGKSTILKLLLRLYEVTMGCIKIDGKDISKVTQQSLRRNIGVVPQNATLFNQDISYNIRYSKTEAQQAEVEQAAKHAHIHDKIEKLSEGYSTKVGENGIKLSGGEKRRVVIARTILEGADIILLDEPTTGLDLKTEDKVQTSLKDLFDDKTTIVVSHHLTPITDCDQIMVLKDGQIVERGKHSELRSLKGHYEELWLLEHPEDEEIEQKVTTLQDLPEALSRAISISDCTVQDCQCVCHKKDKSPEDVCTSSMNCYCGCHDLQVENLILDMLKQESEAGIPYDEEEDEEEIDVPVKVVSAGGNTSNTFSPAYSPRPNDTNSSDTKDSLSDSLTASRNSSGILQTIHEVPSSEEREEKLFNNKVEKQESISSNIFFENEEDNEGPNESEPLLPKSSVSKTPIGLISSQVPQSPKSAQTPKTPISSISSPVPQSPKSTQTPKTPRTPKLGQMGPQFSFEHEMDLPVRNVSSPKSKYDWSKHKSMSLNEENMKLIYCGKSYNLKPKGAQVANFLINTSLSGLDRSLPESHLASRRKKKPPPPLLRSQTVDIHMQQHSPKTLMDLNKQRLKRQEKLERSEEKERRRAHSMIDEAASVVSLLPDELSMMETLPDHYDEETLNPLCASVNSPRGIETFKKFSQNSDSAASFNNGESLVTGGDGKDVLIEMQDT